MMAALYERTGPAREVLRLEEMLVPTPKRGEVRVRLNWSGVNPSDVKSRAGLRTKTLPFPRIIPHSDGAGVIDEVGEQVPRSRIGERVWIWNAAWERAFGTAAEYVVIPDGQAVRLPDGVALEVGACLGIPALTALHALNVDGGVEGKSVLIAGGAGAVGHYAVQMARLKGAKQVIATVSSAEKAALAREAGADVVLNYRKDDLPARVRELTEGLGVERIVEVDMAANAARDMELLRAEGDIIVYGSGASDITVSFSAGIRKHARIRFFLVYSLNQEDRTREQTELTAMLESNSLRHNIGARLPLPKIAEAHEMVEQGRAMGNVILQVA